MVLLDEYRQQLAATIAALKQAVHFRRNDSITIEQKYQPQKTIVSNTRFLFGTNHPITVPKEEDDEAFWD